MNWLLGWHHILITADLAPHSNSFSDKISAVTMETINMLLTYNHNIRWIQLLSAFIFFIFSSVPSLADEAICGTPYDQQGVGPWDYFDPKSHVPPNSISESYVGIVERVHLTPEMMNLETGSTGNGMLGLIGDLDYTLRKIPNHPKALDMASRLEIREGSYPQKKWSGHWRRNVDCYFDRAFRFTPGIPIIHMLYGIHLHRSNKLGLAELEYKKSESLQTKESSELYYNMGLLYFDMNNYDISAKYARKAYDRGYPLPGLRDKLKNIGKWQNSSKTQ